MHHGAGRVSCFPCGQAEFSSSQFFSVEQATQVRQSMAKTLGHEKACGAVRSSSLIGPQKYNAPVLRPISYRDSKWFWN